MSEPASTHKLATRVVLSGALAGATAGAIAALSAVLAVDHMIARRAEQRVAGAADVLAGELDEGFEEDQWEPLAEIVDDENGELITSGIRLAVYSGRHRIAGDRWAPYVAAGTCATDGPIGARVIACGRGYRDWVLVGAARSDERALRTIYIVAGAGSLLVGALIAALAALRLSRWALSPLHELSAAIRTLEPDVQGDTLGGRSGVEEVELIRSALAELQARVQSLLDQARRFSADAAHELRTPLATIRGELDLLREEAEGRPEHAPLMRIGKRVQQLGELVERLLSLSSPLVARDMLREAVPLADIAAEVVASLPEGERARVELRAGSEDLVRGDESLLRSLVANAVDNALKFSGALPVTVELAELEAEGARWIRLTARDRGPGIPVELRARVFEPFFRAAPGATPGHGLGLALIGHIARAHGGRAEFVDLAAGEAGACLAVLLPAWRPEKPNGT